MSDSDSELLIKIRTILEAGGADQAKAKLDELINKTKDSTGANTENTKSLHDANEAFHKASTGARGFAAIIQGNVIGGINLLRNSLTGLLGRIGAVGAAFAVGWQVGSIIYKNLIDPLITVGKYADKSGEDLRKMRLEAEKLSEQKFQNLKKEFDDLIESTTKYIDNLDTASRRMDRIRSAQETAEIAGIEASMPEGPERQRKIAETRARYATERAAQTERLNQDRMAVINQNEERDQARMAYLRKQQRPENSAEKAKELQDEIDKLQERFPKYQEQREEIMASAAINRFELQTARAQESTSMAAAAEAERKEKARAEKERLQAQIEAERRAFQARQKELEDEKERARGNIDLVKDDAFSAESASSAFDASKGHYSSRSAQRGAVERDRQLAQRALRAQALLKNAERDLENVVVAAENLTRSHREKIEQLEDQVKNLPY